MTTPAPDDDATPASSQAPDEAPQESLSFFQIISSTLAAGFGVQSRKNRERDFQQGRASQFIIAGIVFTVLFVIGMITIVSLVLS